jgi:hypothetical protein
LELAPGLGEVVLEAFTSAWFPVGATFEHAMLDQGAQSRGENVGRDAQRIPELVETCCPAVRFAQDEQAPSFSHHVEGTFDGALQVVD